MRALYGCWGAACLTMLGCSAPGDETTVEPTVELVSHGSSALGASAIKWINGTYTGCVNRSGSWSARVSGSATMDNAALSVVTNDASCTLSITQVVADQTYVAAAPLGLSAAYPANGTAFAPSGGGAASFYGNGKLSASGFGSDFQLSFVYSDDLSSTDSGDLTGTYASVVASTQANIVSAPIYTLSLTNGTPFTIQVDANKVVTSVAGNVTLTDGAVLGDHYVVDPGTLLTGITYTTTLLAYAAATERTISGSNPVVPASNFGLVGVSLASPVVRTLIVAHTVNGVKGFQLFKITFKAP